MKIGTRLVFGMSCILLLVVLMGTIAYYQTDRIWTNTESLYNHPLHVARATRDLKAEILLIQRDSRDMIFAGSDEEIFRFHNSILEHEKNIYKYTDIIYDRYLGNKKDIDTLSESIREWRTILDENYRLCQAGNDPMVVSRMSDQGVSGKIVSVILTQLQEIIDFSKAKAESFYLDAQKQHSDVNLQMFLLTLGIVLLSLFIAVLFIRSIRHPITALNKITDEFMHGNYSARSSNVSLNEIGRLAETFNKMAASVEEEMKVKEAAASFTGLMLKENELLPFCRTLVDELLVRTGARTAAIYFLNEQETIFEHYVSAGLSADRARSFSALHYEGEFGAVLAARKIIQIHDISHETPFLFPAVTGHFVPREIISIPVISEDKIIAVISIASLSPFSPMTLKFLDHVFLTLTARINGVVIFQKVSTLSSTLKRQKQELEDKTSELVYQAEELNEYNIELELQKKQLDEANRLKSAFLSNMSHELRTPLNSVIALSGVLHKRLNGLIPSDEFNYLEIIQRNGKHLLSLINDILDLSRIESGKEEALYSEFSVNSLVNSLMESLQPTIGEKPLKLVNHIDPDLHVITSDQAKCHHILQNIIGNAIKFTEKGEIVVEARVVNRKMKITVRDTGIGISPDQIPFIFDEFRQADERISRRFGGTGLGLTIAKKYALLLEGDIDVESKPGSGSAFTLTLPLIPSGNLKKLEAFPAPETMMKHHPKALEPGLVQKKLTILVVEDSEPQIIQLKDILFDEGYSVLIARNGNEALAQIEKQIPDAMILDLMMPEVDGFEVLKKVRDQEKTRKLPVLILTAKHVTKEELGFLKENHVYQLIQKGDINKNDLLADIQNLVMISRNMTDTEEKPVNVEPGRKGLPTILLVEDNPDNTETVKALLGKRYHLLTAETGPEGLELARKTIPNLILLDISLPGMDGFKILDEIKKDDRLKGMPVIALTAKAMKGDQESLLGYGFDDYIPKPIDSDLFDNHIKKWLNEK
ncbi:MAG: response regulator [Bacteroidota bacterium]